VDIEETNMERGQLKKDIQNIIVSENIIIRDALKVINDSSKQICLVIEDEKFVGTLTDGDIRRGFLNGLNLNSPIKSIIYRNPTVCHIEDSNEKILKIAVAKKLHQIPIIDSNGLLVDLKEIDDFLKPKRKKNSVFLMVGGLGSRLRPLTNDIPKPMLKVGGRPILQTIIESFSNHGFVDITMCLGYKSKVIQEYFQDGSLFGVNIDYVVEEKRLGTAGSLSLIEKKLNEPFFVMNGDLLTNMNFEHMLDFHQKNFSKATMCVREYDIDVPYGVVNSIGESIVSIEEKPTHSFFVNAGIYILEPDCLKLIPKNKYFDMPSLFSELLKTQQKVSSYPLTDYWLDIGRLEDFKRANIDYPGVF